MEGKITSKQLFGRETERLIYRLERLQKIGETEIILISRSWWDKILEKILRKVYRF